MSHLIIPLQDDSSQFSIERLGELYRQHGQRRGAGPYGEELERLADLYYQRAVSGCSTDGENWTYYVKVWYDSPRSIHGD